MEEWPHYFNKQAENPKLQTSPTSPIFPQAIPVASNLLSAQQHALN